MTYSPSKQLVEVFNNNGFRDDTEKAYPFHFKLLAQKGYTPENVKRAFSYGTSCKVQFSYLKVVASYKDNSFNSDIHETLTENELKSIITFCKLPAQTRTAYRRKRSGIPDLYKRYNDIKEQPEWYNDKGSKLIVEIFESIKL